MSNGRIQYERKAAGKLILKVTVDLQSAFRKMAMFTRCFKENHGKLYIIGKLINCRIRKY